MNITERTEKMTKTIQDRAAEFILDNVAKGLVWNHQPLIEAAMLIGASIALELNPPIDPECECPGCGCVHTPGESCPGDEPEDNMTDVEADADTLRSCGWGTDEDYGGCDDRM